MSTEKIFSITGLKNAVRSRYSSYKANIFYQEYDADLVAIGEEQVATVSSFSIKREHMGIISKAFADGKFQDMIISTKKSINIAISEVLFKVVKGELGDDIGAGDKVADGVCLYGRHSDENAFAGTGDTMRL